MVEGKGMALTQDSTDLQAGLLVFLPKVRSRGWYDHFRSAGARKANSAERRLVESAASGFTGFENKLRAKLICLALALGGSTLKLFTHFLSDAEDKHVLVVREMVKFLLRDNFSFADIYADWLPENLAHLTTGSLMMFLDLKDADFDLVRLSTVVSINSQAERLQFERNVSVLMTNGNKKNVNVLETGVVASNETGKILSFEEFRTVVRVVLRKDIASRTNIDYYRNVPLHDWLSTIEEKKTQEQF